MTTLKVGVQLGYSGGFKQVAERVVEVVGKLLESAPRRQVIAANLEANAYVAIALKPSEEPYDPEYQHFIRRIVAGWQGALFLILVTAGGVVCWVRGFVLRD